MITMSYWEMIGLIISVVILTGVGFDLVWTALLSDTRATAHFATASRKRRLLWIGGILWTLYTIAITIKLFTN